MLCTITGWKWILKYEYIMFIVIQYYIYILYFICRYVKNADHLQQWTFQILHLPVPLRERQDEMRSERHHLIQNYCNSLQLLRQVKSFSLDFRTDCAMNRTSRTMAMKSVGTELLLESEFIFFFDETIQTIHNKL